MADDEDPLTAARREAANLSLDDIALLITERNILRLHVTEAANQAGLLEVYSVRRGDSPSTIMVTNRRIADIAKEHPRLSFWPLGLSRQKDDGTGRTEQPWVELDGSDAGAP
jgi:hypothetical protein